MSIVLAAPGYDLDKTMTSGQVFRYQKLDHRSYYAVHSRDKYCTVRQQNEFLHIDCDGEHDQDFWVRYFSVSTEPSELERLMSTNAVLRAAYEYSKGIRILKQDPYECLLSFIISQQKRIPQIQAVIERMCALCGKEIGQGVYAFPEPEAVTKEVVGQLRLGYRAPYLYNAAQEVASGNLVLEDYTPEKVTYQRAMQRLQSLQGVGVKIANCVALFGLGFTNAFPVDTHIQQLLDLPEMSTFREEDCGEYAGLVQQYLYTYALYNGY